MNAKRERFAQAYARTHNATKAAIEAGYSAKTARQQGSRLLTFVDVRARVEEIIAAQFDRTGLTTDAVYDELNALCRSNIRHYGTIDKNGDVVLFPWEHYPVEAFSCVSELSQTVTQHGGTRRLKLYDKLDALALAAKLKGINTDESPDEKARSIREAMKKLNAQYFVEPPEPS